MTEKTRFLRIGILAVLAFAAYLPSLHIPFIVDDYGQIPLASEFAAHGWTPLFSNHELRARATYMVLSAELDRFFGFSPFAFHVASVILHVLCVLLVYATGIWIEIGEPAAFWAAAFFAIQEGHQEAVIWAAAAADLLVFLFGMAAWVCWVRWLQNRRWKWYAMAFLAFVLAVASKESAWSFPVLMIIPVVMDRKSWRRGLAGLAPFFAVAVIYVIWTWITRISDPGYHDTRFSLLAPWFRILLNSWGKMLFVWGIAACGVLLWARRRSDWRVATAALVWMAAALLPYCFLTYMLQVPSRLTYTASAGLAWIFGLAVVRLSEQRRYALMLVFCLVTFGANLEILWVKKMAQFRERAEPSDLFLQAAARSDGTVRIACDPLPDFVTVRVLQSASARAVFEPGEKYDQSCFVVDYRNRNGHLVHESRRLVPARHGTFF